MKKKALKSPRVVKFEINELTMLYFISKQNNLSLRIQRHSDKAVEILHNSVLQN